MPDWQTIEDEPEPEPREAEFWTQCPGCGETIEPGDSIVKLFPSEWVHEGCVR